MCIKQVQSYCVAHTCDNLVLTVCLPSVYSVINVQYHSLYRLSHEPLSMITEYVDSVVTKC